MSAGLFFFSAEARTSDVEEATSCISIESHKGEEDSGLSALGKRLPLRAAVCSRQYTG